MIIIIGCLMLACSPDNSKYIPSEEKTFKFLPYGAKVLKDAGNGWVYFEFDERVYLIHRSGYDSGSTESLTLIE
jgi:hypothetical protein